MIDWASCDAHIHYGRGELAPWPAQPKKAPSASKVWGDAKKAFEKQCASVAKMTLDDKATAALARLEPRLALKGKAATQCDVDVESQSFALAVCGRAFHSGTGQPAGVKIVRDWVRQFGAEFAVQAFVARWLWKFEGRYGQPQTVSHGVFDVGFLTRVGSGDRAALRELRFLFGQASDEEYAKAVAAVRAELDKPLPVELRAALAYLVPTEQELAESINLDERSGKDSGWLPLLAWALREPAACLRIYSFGARCHAAFLCSGPEEALLKALEDSPQSLAHPELAFFGDPLIANHYLGLDPRRRDPYFLRFPELALETLPKDDPLRGAVLRAHPSLNPNAATFASDDEVPPLLRTDGKGSKALPPQWTSYADLFLVGQDKALSPQHVERLGKALMRSKGRMTPELQEVRDAIEPKSLDAFGMGLYAPSFRGPSWLFRSLCVLSGDEVVDRLSAHVMKMGYQYGVIALSVLGSVGSERAMLRIAHVAAKGRGGVKRSAAGVLQSLARKQGLSHDQLADRLVPDLGLDASGSLVLDLGPRSFQVGFDEQLKPWVRGEDGKRRASLPKSKSDDVDKAALAKTRWSALKKDARSLASVQLARFEQAMIHGREWSIADFRQYLVSHPLLRHVVRRLIWKSGELVFRIDEASQPVDAQDDEQMFGTAMFGKNVRLVHPLELSADELGAWGERLADYEILQPFDQLQRETFVFGDASAKAVIERIEGAKAKGGSVAGLQNRGWMRGPVEDAGQWYTLHLRAGDVRMTLTMDHGVNIQGGYGMDQEQKLSLKVEGKAPTERAYSEALRSLAKLKLLD